MWKSGGVTGLCILGLYLCLAGVLVAQCRCDAGRKFHLLKKFDSSNTDTPLSMEPYDSLSPIPLGPQNTHPYCVYPPSIPPFTIPSPVGYTPPSPPALSDPISPSSIPIPPAGPNPRTVNVIPSPQGIILNPPTDVPTPTQPVLSPPYCEPSPPSSIPNPPYYEPSPPSFMPNPPYYDSNPPISIPNPPYYEPSPPSSVPNPPHGKSSGFSAPIVYPPPTVPPTPPKQAPATTLWCVAKPSVPDPIILEAMNYACGFGADCEQIQPSGSCFQPNTIFAHASFAFNSYWQRTKVTGGTCDFGGTAILVTVDPSYDGCHFVYF
ncbi:hypothetical protein OROGR_030275 [Orobanche gracilis]